MFLWHMRLGHMSEQGLKVLIDRKSIKGLKSCSLNLCEHCIYGKKYRLKFNTSSHVSKGILDYVHSDVQGTSPIASLLGSLYFVSFIDDHSRKFWVYMLKRKFDVFDMFKQWKVMVEK